MVKLISDVFNILTLRLLRLVRRWLLIGYFPFILPLRNAVRGKDTAYKQRKRRYPGSTWASQVLAVFDPSIAQWYKDKATHVRHPCLPLPLLNSHVSRGC